jgi:hypothetical protein
MSLMTTTPASTLLDFVPRLSPDPPEMGKALTLTFSATKRPDTSVYCDAVTFAFAVDETCKQTGALTCTADGMGYKVDPDGLWDSLSASDGTFAFTAHGSDEVQDSCTFSLRDIVVSTVLGTATVTVTEHSTDHDKAECTAADHSDCYEDRVATFKVPKFPQSFGSVEFDTDRTIVEPNGSVVLTWKGDTNGTYKLYVDDVQVDGGRILESDEDAGTAKWSYTATKLNDDTSFKLSVSFQSDGIEVTREYVRAALVRNPSISLQVDGARTTIRAGETVPLSWSLTAVHDCQIKAHGQSGTVHAVAADEPGWGAAPTETTTYYMTGLSAAGKLVTSNDVEIDVVPQMPPVSVDLVFIDTASKDWVGIQVAAGASGFQESAHVESTSFPASEGANGTWQVVPYAEKNPDPPALVLIRTVTERPGVDVWVDYEHGGPGKPLLELMSSFRTALGPAGAWQAIPMVPESYGALSVTPDLALIQTAQTHQGQVEVHYTQYRNSFAAPITDFVTCFKATDPSLGTYVLADMGSHGRPPDLVFIQTARTASGRVELSYATGASGYAQKSRTYATDFRLADAGNGTWGLADMDAGGVPDLVYIKTANTDSGRIEVWYARAADGYKSPSGGYTMFDAALGQSGRWQVIPYPLSGA